MKAAALALVVIAVFCLAVAWEVSVWNECRETNSRMFCWSLISK